MSFKHIGIIGGGAWGTALGAVAARNASKVTLWAREADVIGGINSAHQNPIFLPDVTLDPKIHATGDMAEVALADALLLVAPAQHLRPVAGDLASHVRTGTVVAICAKGFEQQSQSLLTDVLADVLPDVIPAVLSGPTFAREVALGQPTAVTLACADSDAAKSLAGALGGMTFRPYVSDDLIGAQIGGAVKNVLAIACGIVAGRGLGDNARAALVTRGLAEIMRFGIAFGANPNTLMGLSGLGDLVLTCTSPQSRNMSLGLALAKGASAKEYLSERQSVAEGAYTASALREMATAKNIEMPIAFAVDQILNHDAPIEDEIEGLLSRPFRSE
jgi:glycerol-3-phosphate dehydrogenase (NAD(P)+)